MSYELFAEINEEQQEIITGGMSIAGLSNLYENNFAQFNQHTKVVQFSTQAIARPNGSSSTKVFQAVDDNRSSIAGDILKFKW